MKQYLDLISLVNSDFYDKDQRLSWHINHLDYNSFNDNLFNFFEKIKFSERDDIIFKLAKASIFISISDYLSHVYDYVILSSKNAQPIYSFENESFPNTIWGKKKLSTIPLIERNNQEYKKNFIKKTYQVFTENIPKNYFKYIVLSRNVMITEFLTNKYNYLKLTHPIYLSSHKLENKIFKNLSQKITTLLCSMLEEKYFNLEEKHKQSINFIIEEHLVEADNNLKNYNGFLKNSKNIILGTSTGHYTRLISTIAKNHNINVWKFDHGGEKCFFDDNFYWNSTFYNTDVFVTYGKKYKKYVEKKAKLLNKEIQVKSIGSKYLNKIFNLYFEKKCKINKKVLYLSSPFSSERWGMQLGEITNPVLYDWQKYLIEKLQSLKYEVIYKMHPKGVFQENNNLGQIAKYLNTKSVIESLKGSNIVIVDYAGTALVEALCAGKDVIFIDMKLRQFNKDNFADFNSVVKIVPAKQHGGTFYVETENILKALSSPQKNIDKQRKLVKEYYLESD